MTAKLRWTGTDETSRFEDEERGRVYYATERPLIVPEDAVDEYLDHEGWSEYTEPEEDDRPEGAERQSVRDVATREGSPEGGSGETFDAEAFIDDGWREVESKIQSGEYDEHLDAIEQAERDRDRRPREGSVLSALEERRNQVSGPETSADE